MAPPWHLRSSHLSTASVSCGTVPAFLCFLHFFCTTSVFSFFSFLCFLIFVVRSSFIRKASRQQLIRVFPKYTADTQRCDGPPSRLYIGVTDVTKNSRLFSVTSTTCYTLLKELVVVTAAVFSPPIDSSKHYSSPTHAVSVRADSSS